VGSTITSDAALASKGYVHTVAACPCCAEGDVAFAADVLRPPFTGRRRRRGNGDEKTRYICCPFQSKSRFFVFTVYAFSLDVNINAFMRANINSDRHKGERGKETNNNNKKTQLCCICACTPLRA
jgi:hypothetical protein